MEKKKPMSKSQEIVANFRKIRKQNGISVEQIVRYLKENGVTVANKTIYGWETGVAAPDINTFLLLCRFYGVTNISQLTDIGEGVGVHTDIITADEISFLHAYREKKEMQQAINKLLDME